MQDCILDSDRYRLTNTRCRIGTVFSPDDGHIVAQNMYRKAINILRKFVHQVGSIYKFIQGCMVNIT
jgi:Fe2+ or Zn2+ uptake regulation protein